MLHGVSIHAGGEAAGESTSSALVAMNFVHATAALRLAAALADVGAAAVDAPFEESTASIASEYAVVLPTRPIPADSASDVQEPLTAHPDPRLSFLLSSVMPPSASSHTLTVDDDSAPFWESVHLPSCLSLPFIPSRSSDFSARLSVKAH